MKRIFVLLLLLLTLTSCSIKREDFYNLQIGNNTITVGYDEVDSIKDINKIESYSSIILKKKEVLTSLTIYIDDINENVKINDIDISNGINNVCTTLNGTIVTNNGNTCVLTKQVKNINNTVILYGDILENNLDKVDRIEISYSIQEK